MYITVHLLEDSRHHTAPPDMAGDIPFSTGHKTLNCCEANDVIAYLSCHFNITITIVLKLIIYRSLSYERCRLQWFRIGFRSSITSRTIDSCRFFSFSFSYLICFFGDYMAFLTPQSNHVYAIIRRKMLENVKCLDVSLLCHYGETDDVFLIVDR